MLSNTKGQPLELSPAQKKLINSWNVAVTKGVSSIPPYALDMDTGPVWMHFRDEIHKEGLDNHPDVKTIDIKLIKLIFEWTNICQNIDENQPLESWWWHLDKIVDHSYPADLLPQYLLEIYQQ
jgi:hypothetical protein